MGFIVNPIAGMGGSVGLKGTDGDAYYKALERGAQPVSPRRALEFLNSIELKELEIYAVAGVMGEDYVVASRHRDKLKGVVGERKALTSRLDTIEAARELREIVDIIVFVGGDGTARDIYEAIGASKPVIGVPSGVKMYSSVFAINPVAAARLLEQYFEGRTTLAEREVLDVDEERFRSDELSIRLYGYLLVPVNEELLQSSKTMYTGVDEELAKDSIAEYIVESLELDVPYILGPGSTVKAICKKLKVNCTLLGFDILLNGEVIVKDAWERDILNIIENYGRVKVILTPIGGQGFLLGRGNQQLSPRVLAKLSREDLIVVATESKIRDIPHLLVDTGDPALDEKFSGYIKVLVDYGRFKVVKVKGRNA
jgi:predicted polyphosphate/ATP-dependent NAD kinase